MKWQGERTVWLCPACGKSFPAASKHSHDRIVCGGTQPEVPVGHKPVPEMDRWLESRRGPAGG